MLFPICSGGGGGNGCLPLLVAALLDEPHYETSNHGIPKHRNSEAVSLGGAGGTRPSCSPGGQRCLFLLRCLILLSTFIGQRPQDLEVHSSPVPPRWNRVRGASRGDLGHKAGLQCSPTLRCRRRFYPIHGGRGVSQPRRVSIPLPVVPGVTMNLAAAADTCRSCRVGPRPPLEPHGQPPARASTGSPTMAKVPLLGFRLGSSVIPAQGATPCRARNMFDEMPLYGRMWCEYWFFTSS